jgi:hypothetical protein
MKKFVRFRDTNYGVSSDGEILNFETTRLLNGSVGKDGHRRVTLCCSNGEILGFCVHQIVAETFIGPCPKRDNGRAAWDVLHKNRDKLDNRVENLAYVSHSRNVLDAIEKGLFPLGEKHHRSKLNNSTVKELKLLMQQGKTNLELSVMFGISDSAISRIRLGKTWRSISPEVGTFRKQERYPKELKESLREGYLQGKTMLELAEEFGVRYMVVWRALRNVQNSSRH